MLDRLRADDDLAAVPVIMLTHSSDPELLVEALRRGAHDYLRTPFDPEELDARVMAALRVKRLHDALLDANQRLALQALTDDLTGLANRRHGGHQLEREIALCVRHGRLLALAHVDVDHFKLINDTLGHQAGDEVLAEVARRLAEAGRGGDELARWGGDEFVSILPDTDKAGALRAAERLRAAVAAHADGGGGRDARGHRLGRLGALVGRHPGRPPGPRRQVALQGEGRRAQHDLAAHVGGSYCSPRPSRRAARRPIPSALAAAAPPARSVGRSGGRSTSTSRSVAMSLNARSSSACSSRAPADRRALADRARDHRLEAAVAAQQVGRRLLADPLRPGQAVGRVAAQRDEVRHDPRRRSRSAPPPRRRPSRPAPPGARAGAGS